MSDLVGRLRSEAVLQADGLQRVGIDLQANQFMHWEAADEIERLQRELADARHQAFEEAGNHVAQILGPKYGILANTIRNMGPKAQPHSETRQEQR